MPKGSDRCIKSMFIAFICVYMIALVAGLAMHQLLLFVAIINAAAGILIMGYFTWNKMRGRQSATEQREIIVLLLEGICIASSVYTIIVTHPGTWLTVLQYVVFALQAILLALFLFFMLTFKIKKLF